MTGALGRRELLTIGGLWALLVFAYCYVNAAAIGAMRLPDADDYLRLQQVRDWLAGQSWFDVSQHRINPPEGGLLHWSRVVDLPLAFVIVLMRPFVGQAQAELIAAVAMPMLTMGVIMLLVGAITARLVGKNWAAVAAFAAPLSGLIYTQIMPLRVDHHGWQIVAALTMLWALLDEERQRRSGVIAGIAGAFWLNISIEGLPIVVCVGALLGVRWLIDGRALARLQAFVWTLTLSSALLETATIANTWALAECDRLSRPYVIALVIASAGAACGALSIFAKDWRARVALGAGIVVAAGGLFALKAPQCLAGPFEAVDPLTQAVWLDHVAESMPLWRVGIGAFITHGGFALVGCLGAAWAVRSSQGAARLQWISLLVLCVAASALMLLLLRTGAVAHAFAAPGAAFAGREVFVRARASSKTLARVFGSVFAILLALPVLWLPAIRLDHKATRGQTAACGAAIDALRTVPPGTIFAPLDVSPAIVARTPHAVVATGHHRNHVAMHDVISAFTGDEALAHAEITAHGARYVMMCATAPEARLLSSLAPDGFAAQLMSDRAPAWLERMTVEGADERLLMYRVRD